MLVAYVRRQRLRDNACEHLDVQLPRCVLIVLIELYFNTYTGKVQTDVGQIELA